MQHIQTSFLDNEIAIFTNMVKPERTPVPGFVKGSYVIYDGPSQFDGSDIVVIATGLKSKSQNSKTGDMVQTWIIRKDLFPSEALKTGADLSVCGDCKYRKIDGMEACYVNLGQGPRSIFLAFINGRYEKIEQDELADLFAGYKVRLGAYGDPMAVPFELWENVLAKVKFHTGYSHQWKKDTGANDWSRIVMASVDSKIEQEMADRMGYRTFRVRDRREKLLDWEIECPASKEAGQLTECSKCGLCSGTSTKAKNIAIVAHGILAMKFVVWKYQMAFPFMDDKSQKFEFAA